MKDKDAREGLIKFYNNDAERVVLSASGVTCKSFFNSFALIFIAMIFLRYSVSSSPQMAFVSSATIWGTV